VNKIADLEGGGALDPAVGSESLGLGPEEEEVPPGPGPAFMA